MAEERTRQRVTSKILELPPHIKQQVDEMIADTSVSYMEIAAWLSEQGHAVSKSSIGRYALKTNNALKKILEAQQTTKVLVEAIKADPEADYTEGALRIMANELTQKFAIAQEEWDMMPLDKAASVMVSLSRTKAYKDKLKQDMQSRIELAFEKMEDDILKTIKADPAIAKQLHDILGAAKERMMADD